MSEKIDFAAAAYVKVQETVFELAHAFAYADGTGNVILCAQEALGDLEGGMKVPFSASELKLRNLLKEVIEGGAGDVVLYTQEEN